MTQEVLSHIQAQTGVYTLNWRMAECGRMFSLCYHVDPNHTGLHDRIEHLRIFGDAGDRQKYLDAMHEWLHEHEHDKLTMTERRRQAAEFAESKVPRPGPH
jgi:hypothetical protein